MNVSLLVFTEDQNAGLVESLMLYLNCPFFSVYYGKLRRVFGKLSSDFTKERKIGQHAMLFTFLVFIPAKIRGRNRRI